MSRDLSDDEKRIIDEKRATDEARECHERAVSEGAATRPEDAGDGSVGIPPWLPDFPPDCQVLVNGWWCTILGVQVGTDESGTPTPYLVLLPDKSTRAAKRRTEKAPA